jgi:tetratricopeptide (TPR) repeat protein
MQHYLHTLILIAVSLSLFACAPSPYQRPDAEAGIDSDESTILAMAGQTWSGYSENTLPAVDELMKQADTLLAANNLDAASEKIERALRIDSGFAPAWSRLSSIALANNNPTRAIQMAKRSNSHAGNSIELKKLNWEFIREASDMMNDVEGMENADKAIGILNSL